MTKIKVGMLILLESDLEKALDFYKKIGFKLRFHLKEKWAEFEIGDVKLGLCPMSQDPFDRHTGIVLEVEDIYALQNELKKNRIILEREPFEAIHGIMASIKDPGGNIIDVYQPTPEKVEEIAKRASKESLD